MSKLFHTFFDSFRVITDLPNTVHIGKRHIGAIEFYPSETNPFIDGHGYVRVYDNGELFVDEYLAKLITYTDSHREFMEFCFDLWLKKTNQKIFPNCVILENKIVEWGERIAYRPYLNINYLVD